MAMRSFTIKTMRPTVFGLLVLLVACGSSASEDTSPVLSPLCAVTALQTCTPHAQEAPEVQEWKHKRSRLVVDTWKNPNHSVQDVLVAEGSPVTIEGKMTYGNSSKDLQEESVSGFLDTAAGWIPLGEGITNKDGRVRFSVEPRLGIGVYGIRLYVAGDASAAEAKLWVLPRGTRLAVFDIDGTLTTSDKEIIKNVESTYLPFLRKEHVPAAYPGAAQLTRAQASLGSVNVYLTGRPYWLAKTTREWLAGPLGFAPGVLHVTDSEKEALTTERGVGDFKAGFLEKLTAAGFILDVAYGNATTDIYAYKRADLEADSIWIIGPHGGAGGTHKVTGSWEDRVREVALLPPVSQPWD
jgi:phosphatidate phosphatase PAH1